MAVELRVGFAGFGGDAVECVAGGRRGVSGCVGGWKGERLRG